MKRFISIFLLLGLLLTMAPAAYGGILPDSQHMEITLEELSGLSYDHELFLSCVEDVAAVSQNGDSVNVVREGLETISEMYRLMETKMELASVATYQNINDEEANEIYMTYMDFYYEADEKLSELVPLIMESPCAEALDLSDSVFSYYTYGEWEGYSQEELALYEEEQEITDQYYNDLAEEYTVDYQGKTYTQMELDEAWYNYELSDEEYDEAATMLAKVKNDALAGYYIDLVNNRRAQTAIYDYNDPAAYYDDWYYYRDISGGHRNMLYRAVKEHIAPLLAPLEDMIYDDPSYEDRVFTEEELLETVQESLMELSPEFSAAMDYMLKFGYYDIAYDEQKTEGAMTTWLYYPNAPFLLMKPVGNSYDYTTLIHEFGHYNAFYCSPDPLSSNLDLAEIHSQGLELLMLPQYKEIFGENARTEELYTIYAIVMSLVDGCMFDELERYAYNTTDLTVEKMNKKYMELLKEYGYRDPEDPMEEAYSWVETSHMFGYPLYYLSYAVSAAAALELWEVSLTDHAGALNTYLELVALGEVGYFVETLEQVGMENPMSQDRIRELAEALSSHYGITAEPMETHGAITDIVTKVILVLGGIALIWSVIIVGVIIVVKKKEKKRNEEYRKYIYDRSAAAAAGCPEDLWGGGSPAPSAGGEAWGREGGAADALPGTDDPAVRAPEENETAGQECGGPCD